MSYWHQKKNQKYTIADFKCKLSHETWEQVFDGNDVNTLRPGYLNC